MNHKCRGNKETGSNGDVVLPENVESIMDRVCVTRKGACKS